MTLRSSEAIIVLIPRPYPLRGSRIPKVMAGLAVALVVAGCGSSGSTATTAPAAAAATTPATGSTAFDAALVGTTTTKDSSTRVVKASAKSGTSTTAANASEGLALSSGVTPTTTSTASTTTTSTATKTKTNPVKTVIKTVHTKPKIKIVTVTKYQPKYITKTTTVTVAPKVPAGAFLPSTHAALSLTSFKVSTGGVGCVIGGGSVRCDVSHHTWTAPTQPSSCTQTWGNGIVLVITSHVRLPQFTCGGGSALRASARVVQNGFDDTVGGITCQVRGFGVDCFAADKKGFILSPTGYILY
jgi:hypothetical protein